MTSGPDQQTARVNIDNERWRQFRILAIESDRSIAEYLGQLVRDELRRSRKRTRGAEEHVDPASEDTHQGATTRKERRNPIRLADAKLLTELPRPDEARRRSSQPP